MSARCVMLDGGSWGKPRLYRELYLAVIDAWWDAFLDFWADLWASADPAERKRRARAEREVLDACLIDRSGGNFDGAGTGGQD